MKPSLKIVKSVYALQWCCFAIASISILQSLTLISWMSSIVLVKSTKSKSLWSMIFKSGNLLLKNSIYTLTGYYKTINSLMVMHPQIVKNSSNMSTKLSNLKRWICNPYSMWSSELSAKLLLKLFALFIISMKNPF